MAQVAKTSLFLLWLVNNLISLAGRDLDLFNWEHGKPYLLQSGDTEL